MKRVLVAGATGYLGEHLVKHLHEQGYWVRALARPGKQVKHADEIFHANATKAESLEGVCDKIEWVFSSLGITRQTDTVSYMDVDYGANSNVLQEALRSGVKRFGFVSVVNPDLFADNPMLQARERFVRELRIANIQSTVVRATGFFSDMKEIFAMAKKGSIYLFDSGRHKSNPIHGDDLSQAFVECVGKGAEEANVGGPDILTLQQIASFASNALGKTVKVRVIPNWLQVILMSIARIFHRRSYDIASFMRVALRNDMIGDPVGTQHLQEFYKELAEKGLSNE